jgi:uncharacterized protein DUF4339
MNEGLRAQPAAARAASPAAPASSLPEPQAPLPEQRKPAPAYRQRRIDEAVAMKNMSHMHHDNFESRERFLQGLGEEPLPFAQYAEDEDVVTQFIELPLDVSFQAPPELPRAATPELGDWMVAVTAQDRRMLSSAQVSSGLRRGELRTDMLVWRRGMSAWLPIAGIAELAPRTLPPTDLAPPSLPSRASAPPVLVPGRADRRLPALASPLRSTPHAQVAKVKARPLPPMPPPPLAAPVVLARTPVGAMELGDGGPEHPPSMRVKRAVMALSALAMLGVFLTMYVISSGRDAKPELDVNARPRPVPALPTPAAAVKRTAQGAAATTATRKGRFARGEEGREETAAALLSDGEGLR